MKEITIGLSTDAVYRSLMDYLHTQPDVKVRQFLEPKLIGASFGPHLKVVVPCEVKIEITPKEETTCIRVDFDFSGSYYTATVAFIIINTLGAIALKSIIPLFTLIVQLVIVVGIGFRTSNRKVETEFMERIRTSLIREQTTTDEGTC